MAINTLATATLFQKTLDEVAVQEMTTGWMDANAGQVIYTGGAEVKIPKMSLQGLGNYDRDSGYLQGGVTLEYETRRMTQDRGRKFQLDSMDVDETNFIATSASVMSQFQKEYVIPEIDAYRISKLATEVITANKAGMIEYGYTPGATGTSALRKFKEGVAAIRGMGFNTELVAHVRPSFLLELELELAGKIQSVTFSKGGIDTTVPAIDGIPLIATPDNRMYTAITLYDGKSSSQTAGGYVKGTTGKDINFIIAARRSPIALTKQDKLKIFSPDQNQDADAWKMNYRRYHDMWILDNKIGSAFVNIKDAKG